MYMKIDQQWDKYWQSESASGEVFANSEGKKHQVISQFWQTQLGQLPKQSNIIDIACGAGSIFSDLDQPEQYCLFAADYSKDALAKLKKRLPNVEVHCCPADTLPFEEHSFDAVVSQFGIEYAGERAFIEGFRVVNPGGRLIALCHIENGYIDSRNASELRAIDLLNETLFIAKAIAVTRALFSQQEHAIKAAMDDFVTVEPIIAETVKANDTGVHHHLYNGFKDLIYRRQAFSETDITDWLGQMQLDVDKSQSRLQEMRKAALSKSQIEGIASRIDGASSITFSPFYLPDKTLPVAWQFTAIK